MLGTKETKEMLGFVLSLGGALGASMVDGKVTIGDVHNFVGPLLSSGDAFAGADKIPAEIGDLDAAERDDLVNFVKTEFDIPQDKVEAVVEGSFVLLAELHKFAKLVQASLPAKA